MTQLTLRGVVSTFHGDHPVGGVTVRARARADAAPADRGTCDHLELGVGLTDANGAFAIETRNDPAAARYACAMKSCEEFKFDLVCEDIDHAVLSESQWLSYRSEQVIPITLPEPKFEPTKEDWQNLTKRVLAAQSPRLSTIASELATLSPNRVFADWSVARRTTVLALLEQALLDPTEILARAGTPVTFELLHDDDEVLRLTEEFHRMDRHDLAAALENAAGRAYTFGDLGEVESFVDIEALKVGDIFTGVNKFTPADAVIPNGMFPWLDSPLIGYRDYLRERWVENQRFKNSSELCTAETMANRLKARLHQDFTTSDVTEQPVTQVLVPIMLAILSAPTDAGYGFGVAPAAIDPQGNLRDGEYLDYLIGETGLPHEELENIYRLNLRRNDTDVSSPVQQNIETLQRFFTDSYQSEDDPFAIQPNRVAGKRERLIPQFPEEAAGPFFLEYEEWLAQQQPFFPENFYDPRATYKWELDNRREQVRDVVFNNSDKLADVVEDSMGGDPSLRMNSRLRLQWVRNHLELYDLIKTANADTDAMDFARAEKAYARALEFATKLRKAVLQHPDAWGYDPKAFAKEQRKFDVSSMDKLISFERSYPYELGAHWDKESTDYNSDFTEDQGQITVVDYWWGQDYLYGELDYRTRLAYLLDYLVFRYLPLCLSEVQLAQGKYADAVGQLIEPAGFNVFAANADYNPYEYITQGKYATDGNFGHSTSGALPYATSSERSVIAKKTPATATPSNPAEKRYFTLKLGLCTLEWADALYRSNQPESIMRARELYKGVLYLHGEDPEISPEWEPRIDAILKLSAPKVNPAITSQVNRARVGFLQINAGLNFYGVGPRHIPPVRFRVLQEAATRFAAGARSAQSDFLSYKQQLDQLTVSEMTARTTVAKAAAAVQIAQEQEKIAEFNVGEAQKQVDAIQAQIAAKKAEIADHESIFEQYSDFFDGMKDSIGNLAKVAFAGEGDAGGAGIGIGDLFNVASKLGAVSGTGGAASPLGSAGGVAGPFAAFIYSGIASITSMNEAANKRAAELTTLETVALPAAQALVTMKTREVTIAQLSQAIAGADAQLGKDLLAYYATRLLNRSFLTAMSEFSNRLMRRYLDLGGRTAWLAERALAFEQDHDLAIIGFDYFPRSRLGVSGADLLQLHLAELEAARIQALSQTIPVKYTVSLARDFPLAFGQLKKGGECSFATSESPLQLVYPGTYGYRIRNVTIAATYAEPIPPHRGMLANHGMSLVSRKDPGSMHRLQRYPDALPLSDFRMRDDMWVYDLPDETLLPFEGSGIETAWQLLLPKIGNIQSLDSMTDFVITFDMRANYSSVLHQQHLAVAPTSRHSSLLLSGKALQPGAIAEFRTNGGVLELKFDVTSLAPNPHETDRKTANVAVIASGVTDAPIQTTVSSESPPTSADIDLNKGVAFSNAGVLSDGNGGAPLPLNAFVDLDLEQQFTVSIDAGENPGTDFGKLDDVLLYVDYEATVT
jgi:hypothetical protein